MLSPFLSHSFALQIAIRVCACACFLNAVVTGRYLREQQVVFYSQFYQLLQLCFGSTISIFLLLPSGGRRHSWSAEARPCMHYGGTLPRPRPVFFICFFLRGIRPESLAQMRLFDSLAVSGRSPAKLHSSAAPPWGRFTGCPAVPWGVRWEGGGRVGSLKPGSECPVSGFCLASPPSSSWSSFAGCTQQWCADSYSLKCQPVDQTTVNAEEYKPFPLW